MCCGRDIHFSGTLQANQHLIVPMEDGSGFHVNDTELGTGCKTLPELVDVLSKPHGSTYGLHSVILSHPNCPNLHPFPLFVLDLSFDPG